MFRVRHRLMQINLSDNTTRLVEQTMPVEKSIIFVHLPKAAGTLLRYYFDFINKNYSDYLTIDTGLPVHLTIKEFPNRGQAYKFGLVRNPFDWYVSRYFYFIEKSVEERGVSIENDCNLYGAAFLDKFPTVKSHILYGLDNPNIPRFWLSDLYQHMFYIDGELCMDRVGKMENIYDEIKDVFNLLHAGPVQSLEAYDKSTSGEKRNASKHGHYRSYYDNETIDIIKEKDQLILDTYKYKF